MKDSEKRQELDELTDLLLRLRPARSELDVRAVFYEAGFNACASQQQSSQQRWGFVGALVAASLLVAMITAPAAYRLGQHSSKQNDNVPVTTVESADDSASAPLAAAGPPNPEPELAIDQPDSSNPTNRRPAVAPWLESMRILLGSASDSRGDTTLAAFHGTQALLDPSRDIDVPLPMSMTEFRDPTDVSRRQTAPRRSPMVVSDFQNFALTMEPTR